MTLYLKYRPQILDELDLVSVKNSLKKVVQSSSIPHAFLFAGPKGTGKTSAARILARMFNCEKNEKELSDPCGKCEQCVSISKGSNMDVIELDAASNRGIDDIRALREAVKLSPAKARKKVYIIDEAHMLTTEASNALLKTLEEPPSHVIFILATTNPEKLISTIRSRTMEIVFSKATKEEIENSLSRVIKEEGIKVDSKVLSKISSKANGSFRDGVKALEQFTLEGESFLDKSSIINPEGFVDMMLDKDLDGLMDSIQKGVGEGVNISDLVRESLNILHSKLLSGDGNQVELVRLIELILIASKQIGDSSIEELPLEIALIKWCGKNIGGGNKVQKEKDETVTLDTATEYKSHETASEESLSESNLSQPIDAPVDLSLTDGNSLSEDLWKSILVAVRQVNASIEALLRAAKPITFDGKILTLGVYYKFHKERLEDIHYRKILEDVIAKVLGNQIRVMCLLTQPPVRPVETKTVLTEGEDKDIIKAAEEIFGV